MTRAEGNINRVFADSVGIHWLGHRRDIVVDWGEIESVDASRCNSADGSTFIEVCVNHFSGVDFSFHDSEPGYGQVVAMMEVHLLGFSRVKLEAAGTWEQQLDAPPVWRRDKTIQPFRLRPPEVDTREPTPEEIIQMQAAHQASIATCEKLLGRALNETELECVHTGFKNGRIVGDLSQPLADEIVKGQAELLNRRAGE